MLRPGSPPRKTGSLWPGEPARQPALAERVRTLVESDASAALTVPGTDPGADLPGLRHSAAESRAVASSGDVFLLVPAASPAARAATYASGDGLTTVLEITDVAPVAMPHRIRGRGWVAGWLTPARGTERTLAAALLTQRHPTGPFQGPHWHLLRLEVGEAYADDLWGAGHVEPEDFAAAAPDPLARYEAGILQHLAAAHEEQLRSLCTLLGERERERGAGRRVVPVSLDRFGLRVRFCGGQGCRDARFDFPEPVRDVAELRRELRRLFEAAGPPGGGEQDGRPDPRGPRGPRA